MKCSVNPLVATSALLYAAAFMLPSLGHWAIFVWLIPLYGYVATHADQLLSVYAWQGFWWGTIFFLLHMHALVYMVLQQAASLASALIVSMVLILYSATICACWFAVTALVAGKVTGSVSRLLIWALITSLYIHAVDRLFFKIICLPAGYVFAYPLVPLASNDHLLAAVHRAPAWVLVTGICLSSACLAHGIWYEKRRLLLICLACLFVSPFVVSIFATPQRPDFWAQRLFVYAQPPAYNKQMVDVLPLEVAHAIDEQLWHVVRRFPQVRCIFFPESTFPFPLDQHEQVLQMWADNALFNALEVTVILGSHHAQGNERSNTLFCLQQCRIMQTYDKKTYLPFAEYMPWPWNKSRFFSEFLLKNKKRFQPVGARSADTIKLADGIVASPYICSDLFFNGPRVDDQADLILWLVNDSWFCAYWRHLMFLYAKLQAHVYRRAILYIAHEFGVYIPPDAPPYYLPSVMIPKTVN